MRVFSITQQDLCPVCCIANQRSIAVRALFYSFVTPLLLSNPTFLCFRPLTQQVKSGVHQLADTCRLELFEITFIFKMCLKYLID